MSPFWGFPFSRHRRPRVGADHVHQNRDRLLEGDIARAIFEDVVEQARGRQLLSAEHFTVDGTLLEAWAGSEEF